ncbi:MAG TPA: lytic transglycosylase domain-containing protein [Caulobacteraceae bacterium]|jgi:soluble lytic murein transglycosylase-like protein
MRSFFHSIQDGSPSWTPAAGAVPGPRLRAGAGAIVLVILALSAGAAAAQVFEVTDGAIRQVDVVKPPATPIATPPAMATAAAAAASRYGLAPELVDTVARQESGYRPGAVSRAGAIGVMQLMPQTARALRVDPWDPIANLNGGAAYLRTLLDQFDGRIDLALAAYNAGPTAVLRHAGVPPYRETQAYVAANLDRLAERSLTSTPTPRLEGHP